MRALATVFVTLLLVSGMPLVAAQDDAGTGGDAPGSRAEATPVSGNLVRGTLDDPAGDSADWYLMTSLPTGKGLAVQLNVAGITSAIVWLLDENGNPFQRTEDGQLIHGYRLDNFFGGPATYRFDIIPSPGRFYLGIERDFFSNQGTYEFVFTPVDLADLAVDSITISPTPIQTDAGPLPLSIVRMVSVQVRNHGDAGAPTTLTVWVTPLNSPTAQRRNAGTLTLHLAPGEQATVQVEWSTLGQAGDVDVHARASTHWEAALDDNTRAVRDYVLTGSVGLGVDLLNHQAGAFGVSAGTSFGRGIGAGVTLPVLGTTTVGQYDP